MRRETFNEEAKEEKDVGMQQMRQEQQKERRIRRSFCRHKQTHGSSRRKYKADMIAKQQKEKTKATHQKRKEDIPAWTTNMLEEIEEGHSLEDTEEMEKWQKLGQDEVGPSWNEICEEVLD